MKKREQHRTVKKKKNSRCQTDITNLQPMKQYFITTMFYDALHCFCFAFAFFLVSLHGD